MHRRVLSVLYLGFVLFCSGQLVWAELSEDLLERAYVLDVGKDGPRNASAAAALYQQAANAGDAHAALRLGYLFETGDGVPQDYAKARFYYQSAVDAGLVDARLRLALCHLEGWGGPVDRAAFLRELTLAAEAGLVEAQKTLASAYSSGIGTPIDRAQAVRWLERAAVQEDAFAQHKLGHLLEAARRHARDSNLETARTWYQLSAEQEHAAAMRAMARSFLQPGGERPDWELTRRWLDLATESGDAEAPFIAGVTELLHPRVTERDPARAAKALTLAAERGHDLAIAVGELVARGRPLEQAIVAVLTESQSGRYMRRSAESAGDGPTRPPVPIRTAVPSYPDALMASGLTGKVELDFVVDRTGRVQRISVVESTHPLFSDRAIAALRQWRFTPGKKDGRIVFTRVRLPFLFQLQSEMLEGAESLLRYARQRAESISPEARDSAADIRVAKPVGRLPAVDLSGIEPTACMRAVVLLKLDAQGKPHDGFVLAAEPAELGERVLKVALQHKFEPRTENSLPVAGNVVLPFVRRPPRTEDALNVR